MVDHSFWQKAVEYRIWASRAATARDHAWAMYCAGLLEEQALLLERTGRCPEVPLPSRQGFHS